MYARFSQVGLRDPVYTWYAHLMTSSSEYPTASAAVVFSRNFADIYAAASEKDQGKMTRSAELGYGYLASDFDSLAAAHASASLCHFHHAQREGASEESIAYSVRMATSYADMALEEFAKA